MKGAYRFGHFFSWFVSLYFCEHLLYTEENRGPLPSELHSNITADICTVLTIWWLSRRQKKILFRKLLECYPVSPVQDGPQVEIIRIVMEVSFMHRNI